MFAAGAEPGPAVWVALRLQPARRRLAYVALTRLPGRPLLYVADDEVPLVGRGLELRSHALWAHHICETPLVHWSVANETMAVTVDDPPESRRPGGPRGDQVPTAIDLEWEATGPAGGGAPHDGYAVPAAVHGEVLIGSGRPGEVERVPFEAGGWWWHGWGTPVGLPPAGPAPAGPATAGTALAPAGGWWVPLTPGGLLVDLGPAGWAVRPA